MSAKFVLLAVVLATGLSLRGASESVQTQPANPSTSQPTAPQKAAIEQIEADLTAAKQRLAYLRERYLDAHPRMRQQLSDIKKLETALAEAKAAKAKEGAAPAPDLVKKN